MAEVRSRVAQRLTEGVNGEELRAVLGFQQRVSYRRVPLGSLVGDASSGRLKTFIRFGSHRRFGGWITFVKRRVLFPILYWLFEFARENFVRQESINRSLQLAVEQLAIENEALRTEVLALRSGGSGPEAER
jgi:hypothetical protein